MQTQNSRRTHRCYRHTNRPFVITVLNHLKRGLTRHHLIPAVWCSSWWEFSFCFCGHSLNNLHVTPGMQNHLNKALAKWEMKISVHCFKSAFARLFLPSLHFFSCHYANSLYVGYFFSKRNSYTEKVNCTKEGGDIFIHFSPSDHWSESQFR